MNQGPQRSSLRPFRIFVPDLAAAVTDPAAMIRRLPRKLVRSMRMTMQKYAMWAGAA
jgi:hypothetical protein